MHDYKVKPIRPKGEAECGKKWIRWFFLLVMKIFSYCLLSSTDNIFLLLLKSYVIIFSFSNNGYLHIMYTTNNCRYLPSTYLTLHISQSQLIDI